MEMVIGCGYMIPGDLLKQLGPPLPCVCPCFPVGTDPLLHLRQSQLCTCTLEILSIIYH